ncbi:ATPase, partial [Rhodovulum sulfidophilum]|nr:ATPase [Rhodovulum sulfidophilum]
MIYDTAEAWRQAERRHVLLFGMSGLGKTHVSNMLRAEGGWFHYSVDYRIGTRYMGEFIADNFKREAMKVPLLRELLRTDSVFIASNITFDNLAPLSTYLGKPGASDKGGLPFDDYMRRQEQHREAEISALLDTPRFIDRAAELYR